MFIEHSLNVRNYLGQLTSSRTPRTRRSKLIVNVKACVFARKDEITVIKTYNNITQHTNLEVTQNTNIP